MDHSKYIVSNQKEESIIALKLDTYNEEMIHIGLLPEHGSLIL